MCRTGMAYFDGPQISRGDEIQHDVESAPTETFCKKQQNTNKSRLQEQHHGNSSNYKGGTEKGIFRMTLKKKQACSFNT